MRLISLFFATVFALSAAVNGTVTNMTTGKPQAGATVTLYKLSESGLEALTSVKSGPDGKFELSETPQGPHLVQTAFEGVTYNHMLPPGRPTTGLSLSVFDASKQRGGAKVGTHMILVEPEGDKVNVSETVIWRNEGKTTFSDPDNGTFKYYLPEGAGGKAKIQATAPQGMPIERAPRPTRTSNVYAVDFAIKPGETRFDLSYSVPIGKFNSKILHGGGPVRLVAPVGVTVSPKDPSGLVLLGQEPQSQASVFEVKGTEVSADISGSGTLRPPETEETDEGSGLQQIRPRIYERFNVVLGLSGVMLLIGLVLLYRKQ